MRLSNTILLAVSVLCGATGAAAQTKAYIANTAANAVTVIDTATDAVLATVAVGIGPRRVAISPDGARAYVSNGDSSSVSVINTLTDTVVATIAVDANPAALAVTPDGTQVYVMLAGGVIQVIDGVLEAVVATIKVEGSGGGIAMAPDGTRAYVASGPVSVIDTLTHAVLDSFLLEGAGNATAVAVSPDGARAYFAASGTDLFSGGAIVAVDTATLKATGSAALGSLPGEIAVAPDGSRAYVGIQSTWVNTGYGAAFMPGRSLAVIDTNTLGVLPWIDLGGVAATAAGIAVTPDRSAIHVAIPRLGSVAVIDTSTDAVRQLTPVAAGPDGLAIIPDPSVAVRPLVIDALDDQPAFSTPSTGASAVVANVLANDRLGGAPATLANVALSQSSSTDPAITLDPASGAVHVAPGAALGSHSLFYRICELASPRNCDEAAVLLSVRNTHLIDALNDSGAAPAGRAALATVLANDRLGDAAATLANVKLTHVSSTHAGITLNVATGAIFVALGTVPGNYALVYRICELADALNCDLASVAVSVLPNAIDAVNESGISTASGGVGVANVLANDKLAGVPATLSTVTLASVSSTDAGISLNANGAVAVAAGTAVGSHALVYRICERANPANCDEATVSVSVKERQINAVNDSARASANRAGTALASVLGNDLLGNVRATTSNVTLRLISLSPASDTISLDPSDGSLEVLGRSSAGFYVLVYEICEIASPANCDRATVSLTLSR